MADTDPFARFGVKADPDIEVKPEDLPSLGVAPVPAPNAPAPEPVSAKEDPFAQFGVKADEPEPAAPFVPEPREIKVGREPISKPEAFVTRAGRAVSLGLTEPVSAALTATALDRVPGVEEPSFKQRYEYARELQRERQARIEKERPRVAGAGTVAGTVLGLAPAAVPRLAGAGVVAAESLLGKALTPAGELVARGVEGATGLSLGRIGRGVVQGAVEGAVPGAVYAGAAEGLESVPEGAGIGALAGGAGRGAISSLEAGVGAARRAVGRSGEDLAEVGAGDIERARRETLADIREPQAKLEQRLAGIAATEARTAERTANRAAQRQVKLEDQVQRLAAELPERRASELKSLSSQLANTLEEIEGLDRSARAASAQMHQELFTRLSNYVDYAAKQGEVVPPEFLDQYKYLGETLGNWTGPKLDALQRYRDNREQYWKDWIGRRAEPLEQRRAELEAQLALKRGETPDYQAIAQDMVRQRETSVLSPERIANIYRERGLDLPADLASRYSFREAPLAGFSTGRASTVAEEARSKAQLSFAQTRTPGLAVEPPAAPTPEELAEFVAREAAARRQVRGLSAPEIGAIPGEAERAIPTTGRRAAYGGLLAREGVGITPRIPGIPSVRGMLLRNIGLDPAQATQFLAINPKTNRFTYPEQAFALLRDFESVIAQDERALERFAPLVNRLGIAGALRTILSSPQGRASLEASLPSPESAPAPQ